MTRERRDGLGRGDLSETEDDGLLLEDEEEAQRLLLSRYVDGTLEPDEAREVERRIADDPALAEELEEMLVISALAEMGPEKARVVPLRGRRRAALRSLAGALVAAAAAAVLFFVTPEPDPRGLEVALLAPVENTHRAAQSGIRSLQGPIGSTLVATVPSGPTHELRVYPPGGGLVFTCPGTDVCERVDGRRQARVTLDRRGDWTVLWLTSARADELQEARRDIRGFVEEDLSQLPDAISITVRELRVQ